MTETRRFFTDGEAYEKLMGRWSRAAGETFLDWLLLPGGMRWLDVGCGTGAFTELVVDRCAPTEISAIDPSEDQIAYAQSRPATGRVAFRVGDAQSLPFDDDEFDVAAMALVLSFIPDCAKAISEMKRVTRPAGTVATYNWDMAGRGYVQQPLVDALEAMGEEFPPSPGAEISRLEGLKELFDAAGLDDVSVCSIDVQPTYSNFDDFWASNTGLGNRYVQRVRQLSEEGVERLKDLLRESLPTDPDGRITHMAKANAVKGRVPE